MQKSLFEIPQLNEAHQPPLQQCSVSRSTFYQGDCLVEMDKIADKSVDMILCDLPYGTTACKWDVIIPFETLWKQYKRIIKDNGVIVLTASQPFTSVLACSNLKWFKYEWIWEKPKSTGHALSNIQPMKAHENILVFGNGKITYNPQLETGDPYKGRNKPKYKESEEFSTGYGNRNNNDGFRFPRSVQFFKNTQYVDEQVHPTQKPLPLMEYLIKTYTNEGDTVLDNCMGSGTTGVACKKTGRHFIGIEKDEKYFEIAVSRVSAYCG
jgi:DNA modification methylase